MIRRILLPGLFLALSVVSLVAQSVLTGKVTNEANEPLYSVYVILTKGGAQVAGTTTDFDGFYRLTNLDPGSYTVTFSLVGMTTKQVTGFIINANKDHKLDAKLSENTTMLETVVIEYVPPIVRPDQTTSGGVVTGEQIMRMGTKNVNAIASTTAGVASVDNGPVTIKGSRDNATNYYIDGIRVSGNMIPQTEIDQLEVITGGVEARYGDVTGGIISISTRGPAKKLSGGLEVETSQYLDPFGYNLINGNLSGPIISRKDEFGQKTPVVGFRVSAQYLSQLDDDPPATTVYRVKDDKLRELEANPVVQYGTARISAAELLTTQDMQLLKYNPFEDRQALDLTSRLDFKLSNAIDVAVFGSLNDVNNRFTPNTGDPSTPWTTYNSHNNPTLDAQRWRANVRLRHRLGSQKTVNTTATEVAPPTGTTISNASYTLQAGYELYNEKREDPRHRDRLFDYGYVGNFNFTWEPTLEANFDPETNSLTFRHNDFRQTFNGYDPSGSTNPVLSRYNNVSDLSNINDIIVRNGFMPNTYDNAWNLHANPGQVFNRFSKQNDVVLTGIANFNFDVIPGGKKERAHNIQFGLWYEQRVNSFYSVAPFRLWDIARQYANERHILGVDTSAAGCAAGYAGLDYITLPDGSQVKVCNTLITDDPATVGELSFYKKVRQKTGQSLHEYVNIDGLKPSDLSLDMFSAAELNEQQLVNYYGYDYLGNRLSSRVTFEDFFRATNQDGVRTFPVAPFQPVYQAGYIQDKFRIGRDLIVRLGVRVDRFDANQKVLKDPYSLYEIVDAKDFYNQIGQDKPANIGDDYKVYVTGENSNSIRAFRKGDQWFTPSGTPVDSRLIFGQSGLVYPRYVREGTTANRISDRDFDPNESFKDYKPQINVMPRVAFSFPIDSFANFFAHYDVLVQRPPSNNTVSALDFYYWYTPGRFGTDNIRDNANLLPERTVDYEVGYQQQLNPQSAIKVAAFYKEMRNMIQLRTLLNLPSPISSYTTFDNIDFGTVKGLTFQYDLRPRNNLSTVVSYTLQFADGTGSDAESQRGLTNNGSNIRNLFPLSFDERHRIVVTSDYRFAEGAAYNGPKWFGTDVFARAGANIQMYAVSGRPYTAKFLPTEFSGVGTVGSINGARLPWTFQIDARIDKDFKIGSKTLNVYLRSQNLLNRRNVARVYPATGSPTDDGFLASPRGQQQLNNIIAANQVLQSYIDSYQWRMLNPDFFTLPRRVFVGAIFNF